MNEITTTKKPAGALAVMADRYNVESGKLLETLRATLMPKASNEEMMAFCLVANAYDLNPFTKEIYAFPARGGGITPVVSVDGWAKLMTRHPGFDGIEFSADDKDGKPYSMTARVYVKGRSRPVEVTEYYAECARQTDPWKSHPRRMLRHKALIQAIRIAFGFAGIHDEDEAERIARQTPEAPPRPLFKRTEPTVEVQVEPSETPQSKLAEAVTAAGYTWDQFKAWAVEQEHVTEDANGFDDVPVKKAEGMVRSIELVTAGIAEAVAKEGGGK